MPADLPSCLSIRRRLPVLAALLLCGAVQAAPQAASQGYSGLPTGGGLDPRKVLVSRYGVAGGEVAKVEGSLATVMVENVGNHPAGEAIPLTFGQVFAPGVLPRDKKLQGKTPSGVVPLQLDIKASHPDGSVRHAVVSAVVPRPAQGKPVALALVEAPPSLLPGAGTVAAILPDLGRLGLGASITATLDGKRYSASLDALFGLLRPGTWLSGPVANEWHASAPLRSATGENHPHLTARFALRTYSGTTRARIDVTVENNWAFEPGPRNFTYDAEIAINGVPAYTRPGLVHYHHARWRKVFWTGGDPGIDVRPGMQDLMASGAIPNYDPAVLVSEAALADLLARWQGPRIEPMGTGAALPYMPTTGGRLDIGLLPGWAAMYVLSNDVRAKRVTLGTGDLAGSYSIHYRDKRTGRPVSLLDYPYMSLLPGQSHTYNPATGKYEAFPSCAAADACTTANTDDRAHQPSLAYLPYLLTGDHYYLEELQFWAMYNVFWSNPAYREAARGLVKTDQLRGSAWALRTLAHAAWITPDGDPLKGHFLQLLDSNLEWYNANFTNNPQANKLGVIVQRELSYDKGSGLAPWQDDFFTSAIGHIADLGFAKARPLLAWKARFPVERMVGAGACWIEGAMYSMRVRDGATAPLYDTIEQVYRANHTPEFIALPCAGPEMAAALKLAPGEMSGSSNSTTGIPSTMQPALAYSAGAAGDSGRKAWERFMARSVKPDYGTGPQFAIVPR